MLAANIANHLFQIAEKGTDNQGLDFERPKWRAVRELPQNLWPIFGVHSNSVSVDLS